MSHKIVLFRTEKRGDAYGKEFSKWKILFHRRMIFIVKIQKTAGTAEKV